MSTTFFSVYKLKKSHSPARKIFLEETVQNTSLLSLSRLRSRKAIHLSLKQKNLSSLSTPQNKAVSSQVFRPKLIREAFLVEPSDYNKMKRQGQNLANRSTGSISKPKQPSKLNRLISQFSENKWKKIDFFKSKPSICEEISKKYFQCIRSNNYLELESLLKGSPNLISECDSLGMNGLHWAAKRNNVRLAKVLSNFKVNIYSKDCLGRTASDIAIKWKSYEFLEYFSEISTKVELIRKKDTLKF